jgi:hypothetical protein
VSKLQSPEIKFTYWGIENLDPGKDIWGVDIPDLQDGDQLKARVLFQCPSCSAREALQADEMLLACLQEKGGVERTCKICMISGLWKLQPYQAV